MPSDDAIRFVRVFYDDRREFPWVIRWGIDHDWKSCRTKEHADELARELQQICENFAEWNYRRG